jgi:hypothetical protein
MAASVDGVLKASVLVEHCTSGKGGVYIATRAAVKTCAAMMTALEDLAAEALTL